MYFCVVMKLNKMRTTFFALTAVFFTFSLQAQMINGTDTLYGNEWIDYDKTYFELKLADDGVYRVDYVELQDMGFPVDQTTGANIQLFYMGEEYPLHLSTNGALSATDYLEFVGRKNRGDIDHHLYINGKEDQLNPEYSLFTDTSSYYITFDNNVEGLRFEDYDQSGIANMTAERFYIHEELSVFSDFHFKPIYRGSDHVRYSYFDIGEGFGTTTSDNFSTQINADNLNNDGQTYSEVTIRLAGNPNPHELEIGFNNNNIVKEDFNGFGVKQYTVQIPNAEVVPNNTIDIKGVHGGNFTDGYSVAYVKLQYPRTPEIDNGFLEFVLPSSSDDKYYEFNVLNNDDSFILIDSDNNFRYPTLVDNGVLKFKVAASDKSRKILVYQESQTQKVNTSYQRNFIDYTAVDPDFLFVTSKRLFEGPNNVVQNYANYRGTPEGGGYIPYVAIMEDLIDQFSYGIDRHNIANRNFAHFAEENWSNLEYWYNVGRGLEYQNVRTEEGFLEFYTDNHVQTFGSPGSDMVMLASNGERVPKFKLGRIAVTTEDELGSYFEKIKLQNDLLSLDQTYEAKGWTKEMIHLSGGSPEIQNVIFNSLESMREIIEVNKFGANVNTFKKTSSNPIQPAEIDQILELIDNGLSIITFFGHSGVGTFDFNIEKPSEWSNQGKYPLVISLGCLSGNVFTKSKGLSEEFVLEPETGAIAFLASAGTAYIQSQAAIGAKFYDYLGEEMYGSTIGSVIKVIYDDNKEIQNLANITLMQQLTLHGDPAIRLNPHPGPDYTFDFSSVQTNPGIVDTNLDSFEVSFDVVNIGNFMEDSMKIKIEHVLNDGTINYSSEYQIDGFPYRKNIKLNVPISGADISGKNSIRAYLDTDNQVEELPDPSAEMNNELNNPANGTPFSFYSTNNTLNPTCPEDFGIVNTTEVTLHASTLNAFEKTNTKYLFEIDTTEKFNSPSLTKHDQTSAGGLISWSPGINFEEGDTYYWRVSPDSTSADIGYQWRNRSFVYLPDSDYGWNQNHYEQYAYDDLDGIDFSLENEMIYDTSSRSIELVNGLWNIQSNGIKVDNSGFSESARPWQNLSTGVSISVVDPLTGKFWLNGTGSPWGGDYGSITGGTGVKRAFAYPTSTTEERAKIIDFLNDDIPDGYYVIFWTLVSQNGDYFYHDEWAQDSLTIGNNIFQVLENQGSLKCRELITNGSVPYSFMYRKNIEAIDEGIGSGQEDVFSTQFFLPRAGVEGVLTTVPIGPAKSWDRLEWRSSQVEVNDLSNFYIETYNNQNVLVETFDYPNSTEAVIDLSFLDPILHPTIKLKYESFDQVDRTTPQIDYLRVYYEGYPDIALDPLKNLVFNSDTLQQGENLFIQYSITNLSSFALEDSITVNYLITDNQNQTILKKATHSPLDAGESKAITFVHNTVEMLGDYTIAINLNLPEGVREKIDFNNFGIRSFTVQKDNKNPLLDVTFDGYHILDGDIVAPEPLINITLEDDNPFLLLTDTSTLQLILTHPNGDIEYFDSNDSRIQFFPAENAQDNKARLEFTPYLQNEGEYKLKVQGWDASGNVSGNNDYQRTFQVITTEAVSNVLNYPNPFSTSTQFVFTITGSVPDFMKIEIRSMSGKVVKEIFKEELGLLRVGTNRTDYRWNGTDEYGQKLANGVYLYKVVTKNMDGEQHELYDNGTSEYFTKGYGKMVIMR